MRCVNTATKVLSLPTAVQVLQDLLAMASISVLCEKLEQKSPRFGNPLKGRNWHLQVSIADLLPVVSAVGHLRACRIHNFILVFVASWAGSWCRQRGRYLQRIRMSFSDAERGQEVQYTSLLFQREKSESTASAHLRRCLLRRSLARARKDRRGTASAHLYWCLLQRILVSSREACGNTTSAHLRWYLSQIT